MDKFLIQRAFKRTPEKRRHQSEEEDADCGKEKNGPEEKSPTLPLVPLNEPHQMHAKPWREIRAEGLNCSYTILFVKAKADELFQELEKEVEYFEGK